MNNILDFRLFCKTYEIKFPEFEFIYSQEYISLKKICECHIKWYGVNTIIISGEQANNEEDSIIYALKNANEFLKSEINCLAVIKMSN